MPIWIVSMLWTLLHNLTLGILLRYAYNAGKDNRFLIPAVVEKSESTPITVVVNWTAGLKK
jgi:hypothetical protein